jgi:hypothetical protein
MHFSNPCSRAKGFVLSPLPELGTMGSKWGGARVTDSSTSSRIWVVAVYKKAMVNEIQERVFNLKTIINTSWHCWEQPMKQFILKKRSEGYGKSVLPLS